MIQEATFAFVQTVMNQRQAATAQKTVPNNVKKILVTKVTTMTACYAYKKSAPVLTADLESVDFAPNTALNNAKRTLAIQDFITTV